MTNPHFTVNDLWEATGFTPNDAQKGNYTFLLNGDPYAEQIALQ